MVSTVSGTVPSDWSAKVNDFSRTVARDWTVPRPGHWSMPRVFLPAHADSALLVIILINKSLLPSSTKTSSVLFANWEREREKQHSVPFGFINDSSSYIADSPSSFGWQKRPWLICLLSGDVREEQVNYIEVNDVDSYLCSVFTFH